MKLYTCGQGGSAGKIGHPCGRAANALADAGYKPEITKVGGYRLLPWTRKGDVRDEIERISGQKDVPVVVLDDGEVISGTSTIVEWAKAHPAA